MKYLFEVSTLPTNLPTQNHLIEKPTEVPGENMEEYRTLSVAVEGDMVTADKTAEKYDEWIVTVDHSVWVLLDHFGFLGASPWMCRMGWKFYLVQAVPNRDVICKNTGSIY